MLFRVDEKNYLAGVLYWGTSNYHLPEVFWDKFRSVDFLIFEPHSVQTRTPAEILRRVPPSTPEMKAMFQKFSKSVHAEVAQKKIRSAGIWTNLYFEEHPTAALLKIASDFMECFGYSPFLGFTSKVFDEIFKTGRPVVTLQTNDKSCSSYSWAKVSEKDLETHAERLPSRVIRMNESYGDIIQMVLDGRYDDVFDLFQHTHSELTSEVVLEGNIETVKNLSYISSETKGSWLCCIRASSIGGPNGIVQILKRRGHKIEAC